MVCRDRYVPCDIITSPRRGSSCQSEPTEDIKDFDPAQKEKLSLKASKFLDPFIFPDAPIVEVFKNGEHVEVTLGTRAVGQVRGNDMETHAKHGLPPNLIFAYIRSTGRAVTLRLITYHES